MKILLALQFWKGDQALASRVARYIADLEPAHCDKADFLFISRFDCPHDSETERYVGRKFNVFSVTSKRRGTGWPHGPNDLWFAAMDWIYTMAEARKIPRYKAVFTFEADGAPLIPNWLQVFHNGWDTAQIERPTPIYGAFLQYPEPHVNGNALFSCDPDFLHFIARKLSAASPHIGWDFEYRSKFKEKGWGNFPAIKSYWRTQSFSEKSFHDEVHNGVAYLHGVKDGSLVMHGRKIYNLPTG